MAKLVRVKLIPEKQPNRIRCWLCSPAVALRYAYTLVDLRYHLRVQHRLPWSNQLENELLAILEFQESTYKRTGRKPYVSSVLTYLQSKWSAPDESELIEKLKGSGYNVAGVQRRIMDIEKS